jgi:predicted GNAT family N-acyltransferase
VAKEHGFTKLVMHARDTAIGFYSKCGYRVVGNEFYEVGLKHFVMEKELGNDLNDE